MKKVTIFLLNFIGIPLVCNAALKPFRHGLAVCDARKGQWDSACSRMMNLLAQDYDDPQILYDAGVAAYRTGQFEQARAYFQDCCASGAACTELKERAYFNKGNAEVEQKKLEDALKAYEQVLKLNPDNEVARHNRDTVKKMLEQQKQQQKDDQKKDDSQDQQSENNEQKKGDKESDQKDSNGNDRDNKKKNGNEKQEKNDQAKGDDKDQSGAQDRGDDNQSSEQKNQKKDAQRDDQSQEKNDGKNPSDKQDRGNDDKKDDDVSASGDERDSAGNQETLRKEADKATGDQSDEKQQSGQKDGEQEKKSQHGALEKEQKDENLEKNERALAAAHANDDDLFNKQQAWMAQLLQEQENADKETNKKLVKATVASAMVDNNGNNSW